VRPDSLVADRFIGSALAGEDRVLGFDGFLRTGQRCDPEELAEQLTTEHPVVLQLLIPAVVLCGHAVAGRGLGDVQAAEQIGPEIGHPLSVSQILGAENVILRPIKPSWR
jgi:hypothetical protein